MRPFLWLVFLVVVSSSMSAAAQTSPAEIQKALAGKRVAINCADGTSGIGIYRSAKGRTTLSGTYTQPGKPPVKDTGIVRAQGDSLCLRFKTIDAGAENCFGVTRTSERSFSFTKAGGLAQACTASVQ